MSNNFLSLFDRHVFHGAVIPVCAAAECRHGDLLLTRAGRYVDGVQDVPAE